LIESPEGFLYGTTYSGGASNAGTIYKVPRDGGACQVLWSFGAGTNDARNPYGGLLLASDGRIYGTTVGGGTNKAGAVFRLTPATDEYALIRSFGGALNSPTNPFCRLIEGPGGVLYGTTVAGGTNGLGSAFRMALDGSGFAQLRSFKQTDNTGYRPKAGLILGSDNLLYGSTSVSSSAGPGTLFRMATNGGSFTVIQTFTNGFSPAPITEASDGRLFGVASGIGSSDSGVVFAVGKAGASYTVARVFSADAADGRYPRSALTPIPGDGLLGTTYVGGAGGFGTLYYVPTQPFIAADPQPRVLMNGASTLLSFDYSGAAPFSYQWFHNGTAIPGATNSALSISAMTASLAGNYWVVIGGGGASVTSSVAAITGYDFTWAESQARFAIAGVTGAGYRIQASDSLPGNWFTLTNFVLSSTSIEIADEQSSGLPHRFYQLIFEHP
jgi:uncharacterized repeat protein (TIGR03803 family)